MIERMMTIHVCGLCAVQELRSFMDGVLVIDQDLVTEAVRTLALNTLAGYRNGVAVKWNDAELAIYLVYIFGEINKCKHTTLFNFQFT